MPVPVAVTLSTYATTGSAVRLRAYVYNANTLTWDTADEKAMTESPAGSGQFLYTSTLSLTNSTGPYHWEARVVTAQTTPAYDASANVVRTRGLLGYVVNGLMLDSAADLRGVNGEAVSFVTNFPIVLPFTATSVNPGPTLNNIRNLYQYSAPIFQWTILDATGAAVSLSGKSLQLKVYTDDGAGTRTTRYAYTTSGGTVTISGASNNVVAVTFSATHTATVYPNLRYELQNTTDKLVLAAGSIDMVPAMDMT